MLMPAETKPIKPVSVGNSVVKVSGLPVVGNRLLQSQVPQMSVQELKRLFDNQVSNLVLVDVRYESEYALGHIPGAVLVPYPEIPNGRGITKIKKLLEQKRQANPGSEPHLIIICKAGVRSARAVTLLREAGIVSINLTGGTNAWSKQIDPSAIPQYSINDISEHQQSVARQRSKKQRWLVGSGLVAASLTLAALAVSHHPERSKPHIQSGVPLSERQIGR
ncbi:MAG TPA: rhodanese-like domain-containing protein [Oculatellaceae cyanobacterium]